MTDDTKDAPVAAESAVPAGPEGEQLVVAHDELAHVTDEQLRSLIEQDPVPSRRTAYLVGRRGYVGPKAAALLAAGYPAAVPAAAEPPPAPPVVEDAGQGEPAEPEDERNARIRRGKHAVEKGHRIEIHGGTRPVVVQVQSRRGPERNKYADLPRGTVAKDKRERLARKNGAD